MDMASGHSFEESRHVLKQLSHQSSSGSCVGEEIDFLSNVYFEDLQVTHTDKGRCLSLHITPSTADDKEKQYVYLDLTILLTPKYPHSVPEVSTVQSRGLSDAHLRSISEGLSLKCEELIGTPMVYQLVEYARECLTDNNLPSSQCAVCQIHFQEGDDFTKTQCYHYLHMICLARYVEFFEKERREMEREEAMVDAMLRKKPKQLECPICREPIASGSPCLEAVSRIQPDTLHREDDIQFTPSDELKAWQVKMASLLWQQKQKGGVIDPHREDDVIDESWVSSVSRKEGKEEERESTVSEDKVGQGNIKVIKDTATEGQRSYDQTSVRKRRCEQSKEEDKKADKSKVIIERGGGDHQDGVSVSEGKTWSEKQERGKGQRRSDQDRGRGTRENGRGRWRGRGGGRSDRNRSKGNADTQDYSTGQSSRSRPVHRGRGGGRKAYSAKDQYSIRQRESEFGAALPREGDSRLVAVRVQADRSGQKSAGESPLE